jgi:glycine/D-amino acid oxidase-like deaminating enzyme
VLVVGGGIAGSALAFDLARAGVEVVLIERGEINGEASGANSGSIHAQIPNEPFTLHGEAWTRTFAPTIRLMLYGIALWREAGRELGADLEVDTPGGLVVARSDSDLAGLRRKAVIERAEGLEAHDLDRSDLRAVAPYVAEEMIGGTYYPVEGKANPLLAAPAFARAAARRGARILTRTELRHLEREPDGRFLARTSRGPIRAARVVNCAGAEAGTIARMVGLELAIQALPIQTSVSEPAAPLVRHLLYAAGERLSVKQTRRGTILIGGGWDAGFDRGGRPVPSLRSLSGNLATAIRVVPALAPARLVRTWAAIVNGTDDWKPLLGEATRVPGFHVCFFPWMGFTAGPAVARVTRDLLLGRRPEIDLAPFLPAGR